MNLFAIDENLGFPIDDPVWKQFFAKFHIAPVLYSDMGKLTQDLKKNTTALSFLPSANYFYLRSDPFYTPVANALFSSNCKSQISSLLIAKKNSPIQTLSDLHGKTYGYINTFCTSSYFAPTILLWKNGFSFPSFFSKAEEVGAWQLQIDAVISGVVDATMVQEDIWHQTPENAKKTKIIARLDSLPSPLIIAAKNLSPELLHKFKELLFSPIPKAPPQALFNGFIPYQKSQVEKFFTDASQALK